MENMVPRRVCECSRKVCSCSWQPQGMPLHFTLRSGRNVVVPLAGTRIIHRPCGIAPHNGFRRSAHEGREGREKLGPFTGSAGDCAVSSERVICQVEVKKSIHPHISSGKPIVISPWPGHTGCKSPKEYSRAAPIV